MDSACQWIDGNCIPFTGCTAYALTTDKACQSISKRCYKSDLTKCIQQGQCSDYISMNVCVMNTDNRYCYWDTTNSKCKLADQCSNQPTDADTDAKCRSQIASCTTKPGGGCIDASAQCSEVKLEIQCFYNQLMTAKCFWDSSVNPPICKDKTCDNAPSSLTTDLQCSTFLAQCTTKLNGGCILRANCEVAQVKNACVIDYSGKQCFWVDGQCKQKLCENGTKQIVTNIGCQSIDPICITKSGGGCMSNGECSVATVDYACKTNIKSEQCYWDVITNSCKDRTCLNAPQSLTTHEQCTKFLQICTVNAAKKGCVNRSCGNAPTTIQTTDGCKDFFNETCITKKDGGCMSKNQCTDINIEIACLTDKDGRTCFWTNDQCQIKTCGNIPKTTLNPDTQQLQAITLSHNVCMQFMETCTVNQAGDNCIDYVCNNVSNADICSANNKCYWRNGCFIQSCYTAPLALTSHSQCDNYMSGCTISSSGQGCAVILKTCNLYAVTAQCKQSTAGPCEWFNNKCVDKTCTTAGTSLSTTLQCSNYMSGCVINNVQQGCIPKIKTCSDSLLQDNCTLEMCYWSNNKCNTRLCSSQTFDCINIKAAVKCINNETKTQCINLPSKCSDLPTEYCLPQASYNLISKYCYKPDTCVDLPLQSNCSSYDSSNNCITRSNNAGSCTWYNGACYNTTCSSLPDDLNTSQKCKGIIAKCIVDNDGVGCRDTGECTAYSATNCDQLDSNGNVCVMKNGSCLKKSCATGIANNHTDCYNYIPTGTKCTVNSTNDGCINLTNCTAYQTNAQCIFNQNQQPCYWNTSTNKCIEKMCDLQTTSTTHDECYQFLTTCTLNTATNQGCMTSPDCSSINDAIVCNSNAKCVFVNGSCVIKTCPNAILDSYSISNCNLLPFTNCSYDAQLCSTKTCRYYSNQTDDECKMLNPICTTNGTICVERLLCSDAKVEQGCVTDILGQKCQWNKTTSSCASRNCSTAPAELSSEAQCQEYFPGCTPKAGGGCAVKSTCQAATAMQACTKSVTGEVCQWDDGLQACRTQQCIDFSGDYKACQKILSGCTTNGLGKCADIVTCDSYTNASSCIAGIDGPCLWVNSKCYTYIGCSSIIFTTHADCQRISPKCTTDGIQCLPITLCSQTNTNGGCIIGIDGTCVQTTKDNTKLCQSFTKCSAIKYTTHSDCYKANPKCTTDGITCIDLLSCKDYKTETQCYVDVKGVQYVENSKTIKQTGLCKWESERCRDQICEDLVGNTHSLCTDQMSTCTSDGKTCITMNKCSNYTQEQCVAGTGSDGKCIFASDSKCRLMTCDDITNGTCTTLSTCVKDGTKCVPKSTCSIYATQVACDNQGTDGMCLWDSIGKRCSLFTSCSQADQTYCGKMSKLCSWSADGKCIALTCAQQFKSSGTCTFLTTWTPSQINTCAISNGNCSEADPQSFSASDCYLLSAYTFTFNTNAQKCQKCGTMTDPNITTNNTNNDTNQTQVSYQQVLGMIAVILLVF